MASAVCNCKTVIQFIRSLMGVPLMNAIQRAQMVLAARVALQVARRFKFAGAHVATRLDVRAVRLRAMAAGLAMVNE
jgi:hypothetical protein